MSGSNQCIHGPPTHSFTLKSQTVSHEGKLPSSVHPDTPLVNKNSFESIDSIELDDLVRILAMSCPFSVSEKQMLLESKNNNVLAKNLITLFDFYNSEVNSPGIIN